MYKILADFSWKGDFHLILILFALSTDCNSIGTYNILFEMQNNRQWGRRLKMKRLKKKTNFCSETNEKPDENFQGYL